MGHRADRPRVWPAAGSMVSLAVLASLHPSGQAAQLSQGNLIIELLKSTRRIFTDNFFCREISLHFDHRATFAKFFRAVRWLLLNHGGGGRLSLGSWQGLQTALGSPTAYRVKKKYCAKEPARSGESSFPLDLCLENEENIAEASDRTVNKTHSPSFPSHFSLYDATENYALLHLLLKDRTDGKRLV